MKPLGMRPDTMIAFVYFIIVCVLVSLGDLLWILLAVIALGWMAGRQRQ
jgi:hypothetical protein